MTLSAENTSKVSKRQPNPARRLLHGAFVLLIAFAPAVGIQLYESRISFLPVDMPVALTPGTIHTAPFRLTYPGPYNVSFDLLSRMSNNEIDCEAGLDRGFGGPPCEYEPVKTSWVLRRDGVVVQRAGSSDWQWYGSSRDESGHNEEFAGIGRFWITNSQLGEYDLEVRVESKTAQLRYITPRLRIELGDLTYKGAFVFEQLSVYFAIIVAPFALWLIGSGLVQLLMDHLADRRWRRQR